MIITRITGGLGNQMFQYAVARRLSYILGSNLKLDISNYQKDTLRNFNLDLLNIKCQIANKKEIKLLNPSQEGLLSKLKRQIFNPSSLRHIREKHFHFDPSVLTLSDGVYLNGYWQSEKYFADIKNIIRNDFMPKNFSEGNSTQLIQKIKSKTSVCIHIRRGDYNTDPKTFQDHGLCSLDYYQKGISHIAQKIEEPTFFVFSDDISWAKDNLKINYPVVFVDHNTIDNAHEDLRLMSHCKHHIIANSSFSWWGAWLCQNQDKIVIAPLQWFNSAEHDTKDLIPQSWEIL
jgi:hypothetical protein